MFSNMGGFIATAWPALLGAALVEAGAKVLPSQGGFINTLVYVMVWVALTFLLYIPVSVAWIRRVHFNEHITGLGVISYDSAVWRFSLVSCKMFGSLLLIVLFLWTLAVLSKNVGAVAIFVVGPAAIYLWMRLALVFPLAVVGGGNEISRSWALTRGYGWAIFIGSLMVLFVEFFIIGLPIGVLKFFLKRMGEFGQYSGGIAEVLMGLFSLALGHTFAVLFFKQRCPPEPTVEGPALA